METVIERQSGIVAIEIIFHLNVELLCKKSISASACYS
jgi:hypothetical protein